MTTIIFGGSFDPVHNGHVALMKHSLEFLKADRLLMIPAGVSPFKTQRKIESDLDRFEMCKLAVHDMARVTVSDIEFYLPKPSYTVNTLNALKMKYPNDRFVLLCGADAFLTLKDWKDYREILFLCDILTVVRRGHDKQRVLNYISELPDEATVTVMEMPPVDISSTEIRNAVKEKHISTLSEYLPKKVAKYILKNGLYKE